MLTRSAALAKSSASRVTVQLITSSRYSPDIRMVSLGNADTRAG
jgi:hypothetical protein